MSFGTDGEERVYFDDDDPRDDLMGECSACGATFIDKTGRGSCPRCGWLEPPDETRDTDV